ncbi:TetR/AcrR family transcriptional regulator [Pararhodonellum marinum]|uniref:TetR/AcrR family transcriptional regulator n=1 Tax=Pararhodonellum marinum TaxID=2755358 RepID=UPI00188DCA98|nr:TetR/AcrR family transcriptional regulator [Pararhodonellum marinum]
MELNIHYPNNPNLFIKNPETSSLGLKIIEQSILLIQDLGLEDFNFKKLACALETNESSIYRYFENKHNLLIYLTSCYWDILALKIEFSTNHIKNPEEKLDRLLDVVTDIKKASPKISNINVEDLHDIVISESSKAYLTKKAMKESQDGFFESYSRLIKSIADIFIEVNDEYPFPKALAINLLETTYEQYFFSKYFKPFTEINNEKESSVRAFLETLIYNTLKVDKTKILEK